jgi:hypothetical protein
MQGRAPWSLFPPAAFFLVALFSRNAAASRACSGPSDCPLGFECLGAEADASSQGVCVSLPCESDSDCGPGLRCYIDSGTNTCLLALDGGQSCSSNACVAQWQAPCSTDTDCGPGFTCTGTGGYDQFVCGSNRGPAPPPYATVSPTTCPTLPFLPNPPPPGFVQPFTCDAGPGSCLSIGWKTCVAQPTPACTADSQCPSTWTCQCQTTCGGPSEPGDLVDSGGSSVDSGCTNECVAPNSDLGLTECNGSVGPTGAGSNFGLASEGGSPSVTAGVDSGSRSGPVADESAAPSTGSRAGCEIGRGDGTTCWVWSIAAGLAFVFVRRGVRRRANLIGHLKRFGRFGRAVTARGPAMPLHSE